MDTQEYYEDGGLHQSVTLISHVNGDSEIANFASICYGKEEAKNVDSLIKLLITKGHTSVFEFANFTFRISCPVFVARQWIRHRIGSFVERSMRYTKPESYFIPDDLSKEAQEFIRLAYRTSFSAYNFLLSIGVKKEQARIVLPFGTMTEFYWNVNGRSLMNFLELRLDQHAQKEIRDCAKIVEEIFKQKMPITYKHFRDVLYPKSEIDDNPKTITSVYKPYPNTHNRFIEGREV